MSSPIVSFSVLSSRFHSAYAEPKSLRVDMSGATSMITPIFLFYSHKGVVRELRFARKDNIFEPNDAVVGGTELKIFAASESKE